MAMPAKRIYNVKKDKPDGRDFIYKSRRYGDVPRIVDLRPDTNNVFDQLDINSCTGNAITDFAEFMHFVVAKKAYVPLSRMFVYNLERIMENTLSEDSGAYIRDGFKVLLNNGVCPEQFWPYDKSLLFQKPNERAYTEATKYKIKEYHRIMNLDDYKDAVFHKMPVVIGFQVYDCFESFNVSMDGMLPMPGPNEKNLGGHAVKGNGYNDDIQRAIIKNSWGKDWGDHGYFYMPYDYFKSDLVMDMWTGTVELVEEPIVVNVMEDGYISLEETIQILSSTYDYEGRVLMDSPDNWYKNIQIAEADSTSFFRFFGLELRKIATYLKYFK